MFSAPVIAAAAPNPPVDLARTYEAVATPALRSSFVRLTKLRATTYIEFDALYCVDPNGIYWHRFVLSNRFTPTFVSGGGGSGKLGNGSAFLVTSMIALLADSTVQVEPADNKTTGTIPTTPTSTMIGTDATSTSGTWTAPATTGGVPSISYPTTAGANKTLLFTVSGGNRSRVYCEGYRNSGNGGYGKVALRADPAGANTDVTSTYCLCPVISGAPRLDFVAPDADVGRTIYPLFDNLPDGDYALDYGDHPDNTSGKRPYFGTFKFFPDIEFDETGVHGISQPVTVFGTACLSVAVAGATVVKTFTDCTGIILNYVQNGTGGQVAFTLYNSVGDEVTPLISELETYGAGSGVARSVKILDGTTFDTYHLHIKVKNTKNALATRYLYYDNGGVAYDALTPGEPGVDAFIFPDYPSALSSTADVGLSGIFLGNLESALECYDPALTEAAKTFATSIHGCEAAPSSFTVKIDGATVDYAGGAVNATFDGEIEAIIDQTCNVYYPTDVDTGQASGFKSGATPFATRRYKYTINRFGVWSEVTTTITKNVRATCDFALMFQLYNRNTGSPSFRGGVDEFGRNDGDDLLLNDYAGASTINGPNQTKVWVGGNDDYIAIGQLRNPAQINDAFEQFGLTQTNLSEWRSNATTNKTYTSAFPRIPTGGGPGILLEPGFTWTCKQHFDIAVGEGLNTEIGL